MSRVTAPVSKLTRSVSSAARSSPLLDSTAHGTGAGAVLMPKYAELLRNRSHEHSDSSRGITTRHRPTPQPSFRNRSKPLMQTFHSSPSPSAAARPSTLDTTIVPGLHQTSAPVEGLPRMPLLPDNYAAFHASEPALPEREPEVTIVATDPANVIPGNSLAEVAGVGSPEAVNLGFVHEAAGEPADEGNMLTDLWKGMVDDVLGAAQGAARKA